MFDVVRQETSVADAAANRHQWAVKFTVTYTADGEPAKVFVMQQASAPVGADGVFADSLSCIADAIQMTDLPEDEAESGSPFYRVNEVTKLCRSSLAAKEFAEKVKWALQDLADNLAAADALTAVESYTITPTT